MDEDAVAEGISVRDAQRRRDLPAALLARLAQGGAECLRVVHERYLVRVSAPSEVSIVLIDDEEIARVHGEFLQDATPTDVITFPYGAQGEILISVDTAERQATEYGRSFERELALYVVHGILHLCGYDDSSAAGQTEMTELQEGLVAEIFEGP